MSSGNSVSPIDLVRKLSSDELGSLQDDIAAGRAETGLKALDERGAASELIRDQYTGRYPLELLQNANDAVASEGATGKRVKFILTETALLVADQGAGFGVEQVRAICGLARSSKDPRKSVGYKGLGFKSVGEITDAPQVVSGSLRFGFDASRVRREIEGMLGHAVGPDQRLPDYAFPFEMDDADLGSDRADVESLRTEGFHTVMRLPFRRAEDRKLVEQHIIEALAPRLLLFLDATESLELAGTTQDFKAETVRDARDGYQEVLLVSGDQTEHFLVFRREVRIEDRSLVAGLGTAWGEIEAVRLAVAVPLGADRQPIGGTSEPLQVYFQTEENTGISLIFNADFQLELDRRRIARTASAERYNDWLLRQLAAYISDEVIPRMTTEFDPLAVLNVLAPNGVGSGWGEVLMGQVFQSLTEQHCVPCRDLKLRRPSRARVLSSSVPDPYALHGWLAGLPELVMPSAEISKPVRRLLVDRLGVEEITDRELLKNLEPSQKEDVEGFYNLLVAWSNSARSRLFVQALGDARCVRIPENKWARPNDGAAFLPPQRRESDFPHHLGLPIAQLPAIDGLVKLLADAGVEPLEWRPLVSKFLMPILSDPARDEPDRQSALAAVRTYYERIRRGDAGAQDIREAVRGALLPARNAAGTANRLRKASELYFGADWLPNAKLELLYGPFDECDFLAVTTPPDADNVAFYRWLGVSDSPKVVRAQIHAVAYQSWRSSDEYQRTSQCPSGHPKSQSLSSAPSLDRLPDLLQSGDWDRLCALWTCLAENWRTYRQDVREATWRCTTTVHHPAPRDRSLTSPAMFLLRTRNWLPTMRAGGRRLTAPDRVWHGTVPTEVARHLHVPSPEVTAPSPDFAADLGMLNIGYASASDLVNLLVDFESESRGIASLPNDIINGARWVLHRLNEIGDLSKVHQGSVPLLSRAGSKYCFARDPYLVSNRHFEDIWHDVVTVYAGDGNLSHLLRALGLRILDDSVRIEPLCGDRWGDTEEIVAARLEESAPALIALARDRVPSRTIEFARMLKNMMIVCSDRLILEHNLEGFGTRTDESTTAYFDSTGTGYVQTDGIQVDWASVALRLAEYLKVDLGDAFALVLMSDDIGRANYLRARHISDDDVSTAASVFASAPLAVDWPDVVEADSESRPSRVSLPAEGSTGGGTRSTDLDSEDRRRNADSAQVDSGPTYGGSESQRGADFEAAQRPASKGVDLGRAPVPAGRNGTDRASGTPVSSSANVRATRHDAKPPTTASADESQSRFYSYVVARGSREARMADRAEADAMRIGDAGVHHVVAYEKRHGRHAFPQDHANKGFDVISERPDGSDRRVIEIKATTHAWPSRGIPVSKHQFDKNIEDGDGFWLYIVEFATDPERAKVIPIRNPASAVDYFVFDPGWEHLADQEL